MAGASPSPIQSLVAECQARLDAVPPWSLGMAGFVLWAVSFRYTGFDQVYLIFSVMALMFGPGLARGTTSEYSAYSIFNKGHRHLLGDLRAEQLDAEQRGDQYLARYAGGDDTDQGGLIDLPDSADVDLGEGERPLVRSRDANRPCPCGSGKKAKRCCFAAREKRAEGPDEPVGGSKRSTRDASPDPLLEQWRSEMEVTASGRGSDRKGLR
ncbi:unnamed protein product [Polarella glacialis]|uniref:SAYSvFN domain-containing protein n=1 Tax=Polarella glacialis TaxID=89957 RepID=A0A813DKI1_POLGL|nr:unnamed protein product [Polarella glacialis]CAE8723338.1 unnamed protein product [Polarella glacialis]